MYIDTLEDQVSSKSSGFEKFSSHVHPVLEYDNCIVHIAGGKTSLTKLNSTQNSFKLSQLGTNYEILRIIQLGYKNETLHSCRNAEMREFVLGTHS